MGPKLASLRLVKTFGGSVRGMRGDGGTVPGRSDALLPELDLGGNGGGGT